MSDFNVVLGTHQKIGFPPSYTSCEEFRLAFGNVQLLCLDTNNYVYSWTRSSVWGHVASRLYRSVCNSSCLDCWNYVDCVALCCHNSDHNPLLVIFTAKFIFGSKTFLLFFFFFRVSTNSW